MGNDFEEISDPTEIGIGYTNWMKKILSMEESFPSPLSKVLTLRN